MIGSVGLSILYLLFSLSRPGTSHLLSLWLTCCKGEYFDVVPKTFFWKFVGPMAFHSSSNFSTMFWERYEELSKKVDFEVCHVLEATKIRSVIQQPYQE